MVTLTDISKRYGGRVLFQDVNLQLHEGAQYGIVGANGAGKSTLLRILSGEESSSTGNVQMPRRARIGVLEQNHFQYDSTRILDVVMMGNTELWRALREKDELLAKADQSFDADRYSELEEFHAVLLSHNLVDRLQAPPFPEKQTFRDSWYKFDATDVNSDFVRNRRVALDQYLRNLFGTFPTLFHEPCAIAFFGIEEFEFEAAKDSFREGHRDNRNRSSEGRQTSRRVSRNR